MSQPWDVQSIDLARLIAIVVEEVRAADRTSGRRCAIRDRRASSEIVHSDNCHAWRPDGATPDVREQHVALEAQIESAPLA